MQNKAQEDVLPDLESVAFPQELDLSDSLTNALLLAGPLAHQTSVFFASIRRRIICAFL